MNGNSYITAPNNLKKVSFPHAVRNDGKADTFTDNEGAIYVKPLALHDYAATQALVEAGLSQARIATVDGSNEYVAFGHKSDLVTLSSLMNAVRVGGSYDDALIILSKVVNIYRQTKAQLGFVPLVSGGDGIAYDQFTDSVEFVPPYSTSEEVTADGAVAELAEVMAAREDTDDAEVVRNLFTVAVHHEA